MKKSRFTVRVTDRTRERIQAEAQRLGLTGAGTVNVLITEALDNRGKENHDNR